jgi:uncharacterized small protein (DUF1192 family)
VYEVVAVGEVERLKAELAANAAMLAKQCDLAREAENSATSWKAEVERLKAERADIARCVRESAARAGLEADQSWDDSPAYWGGRMQAEVERLNKLDIERCHEIQRLREVETRGVEDWKALRAEVERLKAKLGAFGIFCIEKCKDGVMASGQIFLPTRPEGWSINAVADWLSE